ncbi:HET-domain-containing protein, partial [Stipitochalara longipes BDJ]
MSLCYICQKIDIRSLLLSYLREVKDKDLGPLWEGNVMLREPLVSAKPYRLQDSILGCKENKANCELCELTWQGWLGFCSRAVTNEIYEREALTSPEREKLQSGEINFNTPVNLYLLEGQHGAKPKPLLKISFGNIPPTWSGAILLEGPVWFEAGTPHDQIPPLGDEEVWSELRPLVTPISFSGSEGCLSLGSNWLKTCLDEHPYCSRTTERTMPLPTRVIDVGGVNLRPSLHLSHGENGVWIALSYCWGGETDFKLTQATVEAMCGGISLEAFPKTLRDGICIARALGVRYLWIDALCIFQDSKTDWEIEAPKMGEYYTNAILTVVAGTSSSVHEGIFHQRERRKSSWTLPWSNDNVNGKLTKSVVVLRSYHHAEELDDLPAPHNCFWAQRGWTLQEDLLSWRTLSYTSNQMIWQCRTCKSWEIGRTAKQGPRETFVRFKQILAESSPGHDTTRSPAQQVGIYETWYNALSLYSARKLTYLADRLPAISGIAQKIAIETGDRYFAGLWEKDMLYGLLWSLNPHEELNKPKSELVQSSHYIGPSWSWVSLNASIHVNSVRTASRKTMQYIAQIKEIALEYATPSKFGAVSG